MPFWVFSKHCRLGSLPQKNWNTSLCNHLTHWLLGVRLDRFYIYIYMFQRSSKSLLTYGCFCLGGITHHKPFWDITAKPATSVVENMLTKDSPNTGNLIPYSSQIVCGFFMSHRELKNIKDICEMRSMVYCPYRRRLESLTICRCNFKGSTFSSVILL